MSTAVSKVSIGDVATDMSGEVLVVSIFCLGLNSGSDGVITAVSCVSAADMDGEVVVSKSTAINDDSVVPTFSLSFSLPSPSSSIKLSFNTSPFSLSTLSTSVSSFFPPSIPYSLPSASPATSIKSPFNKSPFKSIVVDDVIALSCVSVIDMSGAVVVSSAVDVCAVEDIRAVVVSVVGMIGGVVTVSPADSAGVDDGVTDDVRAVDVVGIIGDIVTVSTAAIDDSVTDGVVVDISDVDVSAGVNLCVDDDDDDDVRAGVDISDVDDGVVDTVPAVDDGVAVNGFSVVAVKVVAVRTVNGGVVDNGSAADAGVLNTGVVTSLSTAGGDISRDIDDVGGGTGGIDGWDNGGGGLNVGAAGSIEVLNGTGVIVIGSSLNSVFKSSGSGAGAMRLI